jgi:hypothetical protein
VIPDVAVEAAARAIAAQDMRGYDWESFIPDAKAALEAAAPHMLAEAWDLGHVAAAVDAKYGGKEALNPYGSQG